VQELINCIRCGDFRIVYNGAKLPLKDEKLRALASYTLRKMQGTNRPIFDQIFLASLYSAKLPSPAEATDNLLLWFAERTDGRAGKTIRYILDDEALPGIVGVVNSSDIRWAVLNLIDLGLIRSLLSENSTVASDYVDLTGKGWNRVEELRRAHIASKYAFFARRFKNKDLDTFAERCLVQAVKETGYELHTVSQRAGLIDAIMEHEIRRCRFVIADLSDGQRGRVLGSRICGGFGEASLLFVLRKGSGRP
jgi:hypothetical protein